MREYERWMRQALRDLEAAEADMERGFFEWACFKAQQAAEKAVKALLRAHGVVRGGHSVLKLLDVAREGLGVEAPGDVREAAAELDHYYIPPRCPDAYAEGSPFEYYTEEMARRAINLARRVLTWVEEVWRGLQRR